ALGHGRTGTLLGCYLGTARGLSGAEAVREIRRLRPGSIETPEQEQAVMSFCSALRCGRPP
ncbi:DUS23 phosphatase, partial [Cephalopterus ornatus]|nr:DUS23 phosphatase [Cephalopterus ornatus]